MAGKLLPEGVTTNKAEPALDRRCGRYAASPGIGIYLVAQDNSADLVRRKFHTEGFANVLGNLLPVDTPFALALSSTSTTSAIIQAHILPPLRYAIVIRRNWRLIGLSFKTPHCADAQGRYQEALPFAEEALRLGNQEFGPDHPTTAALLNNLAELYRAQGKYAEAEPLYQRALRIYEKALGPDHPDVATSLKNYATLLWETGREDKAEEMEARAKAIRGRCTVMSGNTTRLPSRPILR